MPLHPQRLLILRAVSRSGSIAAAADVLHLTPSAVSQGVAKLEREAGVALIDRTKRGGGRPVSLTAAGAELAHHAENVVDALVAAEQSVSRYGASRVGTVKVGGFASALIAIVAPVVSELRVSEPSIELEIHEVAETEGLSAMRRGELDLLIAERPQPDQPISVREVTETFLLRDPYRVILPPDWSPSMSVEELIRGPWIAGGSEYSSRRTLDEISQRMGVQLRIAHPCRESPTMLSLVSVGLGAALVPQLTLGAHSSPSVQLTSGQLDPGSRVLSVLAKPRTLNDSAVSHVLDKLLDQAGRLSAESMGAGS